MPQANAPSQIFGVLGQIMGTNREDAKNAKKERKEEINLKSKIQNPKLDDWLEIGKIVAPQGLVGEMRVYPNTDFPERFEVGGKRWLLRPGETEPQPIELVAGRYVEGKNLYVIKLAGVNNCNQVEELRGCKIMVPASDRPQLAEDEFYVPDLLGLEVFLQASGELIGTVVDIIPAGNDLLEVELDPGFAANKKQKKVLIPFVEAIAPFVDIKARRIEVTPPPGLLEIND
jgi:16S rRNA processing protein RimM